LNHHREISNVISENRERLETERDSLQSFIEAVLMRTEERRDYPYLKRVYPYPYFNGKTSLVPISYHYNFSKFVNNIVRPEKNDEFDITQKYLIVGRDGLEFFQHYLKNPGIREKTLMIIQIEKTSEPNKIPVYKITIEIGYYFGGIWRIKVEYEYHSTIGYLPFKANEFLTRLKKCIANRNVEEIIRLIQNYSDRLNNHYELYTCYHDDWIDDRGDDSSNDDSGYDSGYEPVNDEPVNEWSFPFFINKPFVVMPVDIQLDEMYTIYDFHFKFLDPWLVGIPSLAELAEEVILKNNLDDPMDYNDHMEQYLIDSNSNHRGGKSSRKHKAARKRRKTKVVKRVTKRRRTRKLR